VSLLLKSLLGYLALNFIRKNFLPPKAAGPNNTGEYVYECGWRAGDVFDLFLYLSDDEHMRNFKRSDLVWEEHGLHFGSWDKRDKMMWRAKEIDVELEGRRASDLWAHVYLKKRAVNGDPKDDGSLLLYQRKRLGGTDPVDWYYPELDVSLVNDDSPYDLSSLHPMAIRQMSVDRDAKRYDPILYLNDFWHIKERRIKLSGSETSIPMRLSFSPISLYKMQMLVSFDYSFRVNAELLDSEGGIGGVDSIKALSSLCYIYLIEVGITADDSPMVIVLNPSSVPSAHALRPPRLQERYSILAWPRRPLRLVSSLNPNQCCLPACYLVVLD